MDFVIEPKLIKEGFNNLKPAANYDNLYYAGFREPLVTGCLA
jgi:hypothetical protein